MRKIKTILVALAVCGTTFPIFHAQAQDTPAATIALSRKLNEMQWYDLSFYLLDREMAKHPESKDLFLVQKAQVYFAQGKVKQAEAIINKIPASSNAYLYSRLVLGMGAFMKGDYKTAKIPLLAYLETASRNLPNPGEKGKINEYLTAVAYLTEACKKIGDTKGVLKAKEYLKKLRDHIIPKKPEDKAAPTNKYEDTLMTAKAILDTAEEKKKNGMEGWKTEVQAQIKPLKEVYWAGPSSPYMPSAALEVGRAYCLLGRYKDAFDEIAKYMQSIRGLDQWYKENNQIYMAPAARAYIWLGYAALGLGDQATEEADKKKQYNTAAKCFIKFLKDYEPKKSPVAKKAVEGFNKAKDALAKLGEDVKLPPGVELPSSGFDMTKADALFSQKKYAEAIPIYLELLKSPGARTSPQAPALLAKLAYAYAQNNDRIEAMALAKYAAECFPENDATAQVLLTVGTTFWKAYQKATNPEEKEALRQDAVRIYKVFLKTCPTNNYADEIALQIANVQYKKATELALAANKMPPSPEKIKKNEEAREAFKEAIPAYQYIVDNFLHTDIGKKSAFYLGCCYTNSRQFLKGAEVFLKFAEAEANREKKDKRDLGQVADAKVRAAENYAQYAVGLDKEARKLLKDAENAPSAPAEPTEEAKPKKDGPKTAEDLKAEAAKKKEEAQKYFMEAVEQIKELTTKWIKPGGYLANVPAGAQKTKLDKALRRAYALVGWAYDGAGDAKNAIAYFTAYIAKYPDGKGVPKAMARLGMLYVEAGKPNEAAQVFNTLTTKFPEEGKKVLPKMAKIMYEQGKYDKSIAAVKKIFEKKPVDISVASLKWIAKNLPDCGGTHPKEGAALALQACAILQKKLAEPNFEDWLGKAKGKKVAANKKEAERWQEILKEQLNLYTAAAAFWSEDYTKAEYALSSVLTNPTTPYFFEASFLRAKARRKLKKYDKALLEDYAAISKAFIAKTKLPRSMFFKNQCMTGDTYIEMKEYGKAANAYSMAAMALMAEDDNAAANEEKPDPAEQKKQEKWLRRAVVMLAACLKATNKTDELEKWTKIYKKKFGHDKFLSKVTNPPTPEAALQAVGDE